MKSSLSGLYIERCAQAIEEVIIPNLTDDFALRQAKLLAVLLHTLAPTVEDKSEELIKENNKMSELLTKVRDVLGGEKGASSNAARDTLLSALDIELPKVETEQRNISEENRRLKEALVETIRGLDALADDLPKETMSSLRQQIRSILRQEIDHGLARIAELQVAKVI